MKKTILISFVGLLLAGCSSQVTTPEETTPISTGDGVSTTPEVTPETETTTMETYDHEKYTISYPSGLTAEEADSASKLSTNFSNPAGELVMNITQVKSNAPSSYPDDSGYEDSGKVIKFQDGDGRLIINKTGLCDGPGCSKPFITYDIFDGLNSNSISFYGQTEESELSKQVIESFN